LYVYKDIFWPVAVIQSQHTKEIEFEVTIISNFAQTRAYIVTVDAESVETERNVKII